MQVFWRISQIHNAAPIWFIYKVINEEAVSQRTLDMLKYFIRKFHLDEFVPLFVFVFMVGGLYGSLAPLSNIFVTAFFACAYKVFKYMALFIYGSPYEGGGQVFYSVTTFMFAVIYLLILIIAGYLSLQNTAMTATFLFLLPITVVVHIAVHQTFVVPSKILSLNKARLSDEDNEKRSKYERALNAYNKAKTDLEDLDIRNDEDGSGETTLRRRLLPRRDSIFTEDSQSG